MALVEANQGRLEHRVAHQIEHFRAIGEGQCVYALLLFFLRNLGQLDHTDFERVRRLDDLHAFASRVVGVNRAKNFMTIDDAAQRQRQRLLIQLASQAQGHGYVVLAAKLVVVSIQLIDDPEASLRERQGQHRLPRHARNRGFTALQLPSKADGGAAFSTDLTYLALQTF